MQVRCFFFILFTSYLSFQNIVTHVYQQQGLSAVGPLNLILNYLSFLISNTLAVKCKYSFKSQLLVGSLAYSLNMSTGIFVPYIDSHLLIYLIVAGGGIVGGISAGFLWVSQGGYLRQICKLKQNKGKYNAIFSFMLSFSSLTAGITTTFFLGFFSNQIYFIALTTLSLLSSLFCILFLKDLYQSDSDRKLPASQKLVAEESLLTDSQSHYVHSQGQNKKSQTEIQYKQTSSYFQDKIQKQKAIEAPSSVQADKSVYEGIVDSLKFYNKMTYFLIFLIVDGLALGIQSNQMNKLIPESAKEDQQNFRIKAGIVTIFIGVGSVVGSYVNGPISDRFGLKFNGKITLFSFVITCSLTFAASLQKMFGFACFISFMWGFTYYLFEGWIYVSILKLLKGKLQAFAINKQVHCVSMAGFQVLVILTANKFDIKWLMCGTVALVIPAIWCLFKVDYGSQKYGKKLSQSLSSVGD